MHLIKILTILNITLISFNAVAADCIAEKYFGIGGFIINQKEEQKSKTLKKAKSIVTLSGEDDGGGYKYKRYSFPNYHVEIVRGNVDRIYTSSPKIKTINGLSVGLNISQVNKILGVKELKWASNKKEFYISICEKPYADIFAVIKVNSTNKISLIEFIVNRP